jgi:hypothetical protein
MNKQSAKARPFVTPHGGLEFGWQHQRMDSAGTGQQSGPTGDLGGWLTRGTLYSLLNNVTTRRSQGGRPFSLPGRRRASTPV